MLPTLETKRLILRPINTDDRFDMFEYAKKPNIGPMAGWCPHSSVDETKIVIEIFINNARRTGLGVFSIILKENNKMIGTIELYNRIQNFKAELGYSLNDEYWGQGIIVEAGEAVLKWGFEQLELYRIQANIFVFNHQSERVCQKLHMEYEGLLKNYYLRYDGKVFDCKSYAITREMYQALKGNNQDEKY